MTFNIKRKIATKTLQKIQDQKNKFFEAGVKDDQIYFSFVKSFRKLNADRKRARKRIYAISDKFL